MTRLLLVVVMVAVVAGAATGQTPRPFPQPSSAAPQQPQPAPAPAQAPTPAPATGAPAAPSALDALAPPAATVYFPVHPSAEFITSYDAGRGQRYYIYGSGLPFADLVAFYRTQLKERGDVVFQQPPTHMFSVGRFREDTMAFPPGVTVKDWTWSGSQGYPNPRPGATTPRYPTVLMIVPPPPAAQAAQ